jgi:hypothetical protein
MGPIFTILTAVFLAIIALLAATTDGFLSISSMFVLVLPAFGFVYMLLTFSRIYRAAR